MRLLNLLIGDYMHKDSIFALVEDTVSALGYILIECAVHYGKTKDSLRIVIYSKDRQITSDDCTGVADIVSRQLDIDDPFDRPYDLIVESPGTRKRTQISKRIRVFHRQGAKNLPQRRLGNRTQRRLYCISSKKCRR